MRVENLRFHTLASLMPLLIGTVGLATSRFAAGDVRHPAVMLTASSTATVSGVVLWILGERVPLRFSKVQPVPAVIALGLIVWSCQPGSLQTAFAAYYLVVAAHFAWWKAGRVALVSLGGTALAYNFLLQHQGTSDWLLESLMFDSALLLVGSVFVTLAHRLGSAATRDALTGLLNRSAWETAASVVMRANARSGRPLMVALLDLDGFKQTNDLLGHDAGDRLLIAAARAWSQNLRRGDVLGRWGGDEFVLLLTDCADQAAADVSMTRLRGACPEVRFTVGYANASEVSVISEAVTTADLELIHAKTARRETVRP